MLHSDRVLLAPTNPVLAASGAPSPRIAQTQAGSLRMPKVVHDALGLYWSRLGECAMFRDASVGARAVMAEFIRCVDKVDPAAPIRIGDGTIAAALGASIRSVQRWKRELDDLGWIQRRQYLTRKRPFDLSHVRIRDVALRALGLAPSGKRSSARTSVGSSAPSAASSIAAAAPAGQRPRRVGPLSAAVDNSAESYPQWTPFLADALDTIPQLSSKGQSALRAAALDDPRNAPTRTSRLLAPQQAHETRALEGTCKQLSAGEKRELHKLQAVYGVALDAMPDPLSLEVDPERGGLVTLPPAALPVAQSVEPASGTNPAPVSQAAGEAFARVGLPTSGGTGAAGTLPPVAASRPVPESLPAYLADLAPLTQAGIAVSGVFALMGMATRAGHRLGNIVAATAQYIRRSDHPFAYVLKLVQARYDWAAITRAQVHAASDGDASSFAHATARSDRQAEVRAMAAVLTSMVCGAVYGHETARYVWQRVGTVILQAERDQVVDGAGRRVGSSAIDRRWMTVGQPASFVRDWAGGKIHALVDGTGAAEFAPALTPKRAWNALDGQSVAAAFAA